MKRRPLTASLILALCVVACSDHKAESGPSGDDSANAPNTAVATDAWIGQWNGPEGTFLRLAGGQGQYEITIQDLDGAKSYQGNAVNGRIQFARNGVEESIRASSGAETGMKWLADKANCLTVRSGEGYCRD